MTTLGSSSFSIGGLVSGMDTNSIVSQLMEIERKPIDLLNTNKDTATEKLTAWRSFNTRVQALSVSTERMAEESTFHAGTATSSNTDILSVTAGEDVAEGSYQITVKQLAQNHQIATQTYSSLDEKLGTGTIQITVGNAGYKPIEITEENNTLTGIRDAINNSSAPVTASILNAGTVDNPEYKLTLTSKVNGKSGELTMDIDLSGGTAPAFTDIQAAQDAKLILGSGAGAVEITRSSNKMGGIISGVTIDLVSADENEVVTISTSPDTNTVKTTINNFLNQFNNMVDFFNDQFEYDENQGYTGTLFSDTNLYRAKEKMNDIVSELIYNEGDFHSLSEMGIEFNDVGKLVVTDENLFDDALEKNMDSVSALFTGENGIGVKFNDYIDEINASDGLLQNMDDYFTEEIEAIDERIDIKEEYLTRTEQRYMQKFSNLEVQLSTLQAQGDYMSAQFSAMEQVANRNS